MSSAEAFTLAASALYPADVRHYKVITLLNMSYFLLVQLYPSHSTLIVNTGLSITLPLLSNRDVYYGSDVTLKSGCVYCPTRKSCCHKTKPRQGFLRKKKYLLARTAVSE